MKEQMPGVYDKLEASLHEIPLALATQPKAILAISGHWEERDFTVMAGAHPPMVYDYSGFPEHTYHVKYAAAGSPQIAQEVQTLLEKGGFQTELDHKRGFDHGVFAPLAVAYPEANVPVLQLSIRADYDPAAHLAVGRALAPLRGEGVLILGSGLSYHNMRGFGPRGAVASREFDDWLTDAVCHLTGLERSAKLLQWAKAPSARQAHPREDHLIPLMVAVGAAENDKGKLVYHENDFMGGTTVSSYRLG